MRRSANVLRWVNCASFACTAAASFLADIFRLGSRTTGDVSDIYYNLFTPAPYAFAIWGVIYLLLAGFSVYQFSDKRSPLVEKVGWRFIFSGLMNIGWIYCWHTDAIALSLVFITALLISISAIRHCTATADNSAAEILLVKLPFSVYFGWVTLAVIANVSVYLVSMGVRFPIDVQEWITAGVLFLAAGVLTAASVNNRDPFCALTGLWGIVGILVRHISLGDHFLVIIAAAICTAALTAVTVWQFLSEFSHTKQAQMSA